MENLLYYPYINLPRNDWTARALIYYDQVSAIVPESYFHRPNQYDRFMREMVRNELVNPINPREELRDPWRVFDPFIRYVHSKEFKIEKRRDRFRSGYKGKIQGEKFEPKGTGLNIDKFHDSIFDELRDAGLAKKITREWYTVEQKTAGELMTFLATIIGKKLNYLPTTDTYQKRFSLTSRSKKVFKTQQRQQLKRELVLTALIPFPEQIDLTRLRAFKDRHVDLLKAFKNRVELIALNPAIEEDSPFFNESINELQLRKEELVKKMGESRFGNIFLGSVCSVTSSGLALTSTETSVEIIGALTGLASAIYTALQIESPEATNDQSSMKYLALVDRRLRNPMPITNAQLDNIDD